MAPGKQELEEGTVFVGGSGKLMRSVCAQAGLAFDSARIINCIKCYPAKRVGKADKITREQFAACREDFEEELRSSMARVVVTLGAEAFWYTTGIKGKGQSVMQWRGYPVWPKMCVPVGAWPTKKALKEEAARAEAAGDEAALVRAHRALDAVTSARVILPPRAEVVLPTVHPAFVMRTKFKAAPYLVGDVARAARALNGGLHLSRVDGPGLPLEGFPEAPGAIALDIETPRWGDTYKIERVSFAVEAPGGGVASVSVPWEERLVAWINGRLGK